MHMMLSSIEKWYVFYIILYVWRCGVAKYVCIPVHINTYRQTSNIRRVLVGNIIVDNSDVVGASPVGAAPTASSLST